MSLKIKICGMRDETNIRHVAGTKPDYMGFIFYDRSPRFVGKDWSAPLDLDQSIVKVGVFVNEEVETLINLCHRHQFPIAQLHGQESVQYCHAVKASSVKVIKAFSIDDAFDFSAVANYESVVDYFLFDTKGKNYGGNGVPFRWEKLEEYKGNTPFFLSGGLSVANIQAALIFHHPKLFALDLNSGVEVSAGIKDSMAIQQIIDKRNSVTDLLSSL